jgi:hypothetical protein
MISALNNVTNEMSSVQWSKPMRATISEGNDFVRRGAVQQHRF